MDKDNLYTRELLPPPESPVKDGKPVFGSFSGAFKKFEIKGLWKPFGNLPIPKILTDTRITGSMRFVFCNDDIIGEIAFFSCFSFSLMETTFWLRKTNQKYSYKQYQPYRFIHMPKHLSYSITACRKQGRYAKIFSRLSHGKLHADFDFVARDTRPPCEGRLDLDIKVPEAQNFSCVVPYKVSRRCQAVYVHCGAVEGWISLGYNEDIVLNKDSSIGFFDIRKTYTGLRAKRNIVTGLGKIDGKSLAFQLGSSIAPDSNKHNENIMLYCGKRTLLPPVRMTTPYGYTKKWIIQDTESMVDLVFTPLSHNFRKVSAIIFRTEYSTIYGTFEGTILTSEGEEVKLKNFPGIIKKYNIRV